MNRSRWYNSFKESRNQGQMKKCGEFLNAKNGKAKQEGGFHECSLAREGISFQWNCFQRTQEHFWNGFPLICLFQTIWKRKNLFSWTKIAENTGPLLKWLPFNLPVFRLFEKGKKNSLLELNFQRTWEHFWNGFPLICLFSDYLKMTLETLEFNQKFREHGSTF